MIQGYGIFEFDLLCWFTVAQQDIKSTKDKLAKKEDHEATSTETLSCKPGKVFVHK